MELVIKIAGSFVLILSLAFALLPGSFGMLNYKKNAGRVQFVLATLFFHSLWLVHVFAIYNVWAMRMSLWWSFLLPFGLLVVFFTTVGKDVSTN